MLIKNLILTWLIVFRMHFIRRNKKCAKNVIKAEIIRNVHSIEKGLSLSNPRKEFGKKKISDLLFLLDEYERAFDDYCFAVEPKMAVAALSAYLDYHKNISSSTFLTNLKQNVDVIKNKIAFSSNDIKFGGVKVIETMHAHTPQEISVYKSIVEKRHSIRNFIDEPVDEDVIKKAIDLANLCPSACNRQTTRIYLMDKSKIVPLKKWISGIGGFDDSVPSWVIVTGVISAFNGGELFQHIMNAGIFVGNFVNALSLYGLSSCVVQRPLVYSRAWKAFARQNNISLDEQIVCLIAVGKPSINTTVPKSYRFDSSHIFRKI